MEDVAVGGMAWSEDAEVVAENGTAEGFVEGDPMLDLRESFEHNAGVAFEVLNELFLVQEAVVAFVELVWKIPVEECE